MPGVDGFSDKPQQSNQSTSSSLMSFGLSRCRVLDTAGIGFDRDDLPSFDYGRFDPRSWFDYPERPFELKIDSGKGTFLVQQSGLQPDTNFLGIEWTGEFYRYGADRLRRNLPRPSTLS
jgi:hypothetical protein